MEMDIKMDRRTRNGKLSKLWVQGARLLSLTVGVVPLGINQR